MMGRREFITLIGAAAATWPLAAPAQQPAMATIGFISPGSLESDGFRLTAFRQGLNETGYVEGRNVAMEYRGMQGHYDLLPAFVGDFVRRPVAVIVIGGSALAALAAKAATSAIPIVFNIGVDPIDAGLVASLNRPGGNITGIFNLNGLLAAKRLELLHELMPSTSAVAFLVNPSNAPYTEPETTEVRNAAASLGLQLNILKASTIGEIDTAFVTLGQVRARALLVSAEGFFRSRREQIITLAARYGLPVIYSSRESTEIGGLMSYGPDIADAQRLFGVYVGRILKGEKPADLPVQQVTKVELLVNLKTAKALGLIIPPGVLAIADEVIE